MLAGPKIVITDSNLTSAADEQVLRDAGITTLRLQATSESEVIAGLSEAAADALIVQRAPVPATVLDAALSPTRPTTVARPRALGAGLRSNRRPAVASRSVTARRPPLPRPATR
jgi:hypothetical protein